MGMIVQSRKRRHRSLPIMYTFPLQMHLSIQIPSSTEICISSCERLVNSCAYVTSFFYLFFLCIFMLQVPGSIEHHTSHISLHVLLISSLCKHFSVQYYAPYFLTLFISMCKVVIYPKSQMHNRRTPCGWFSNKWKYMKKIWVGNQVSLLWKHETIETFQTKYLKNRSFKLHENFSNYRLYCNLLFVWRLFFVIFMVVMETLNFNFLTCYYRLPWLRVTLKFKIFFLHWNKKLIYKDYTLGFSGNLNKPFFLISFVTTQTHNIGKMSLIEKERKKSTNTDSHK